MPYRLLALRILVTLAEQGIVPSGYIGPAGVYLDLSESILVSGDYPSALIAALAAREHYRRGSAAGNWDRQSFEQTLDELVGLAEPKALQARGSASLAGCVD